ncbi:MAG: hypothetical protein ABI134_18325 [Byssovorax sp.]
MRRLLLPIFALVTTACTGPVAPTPTTPPQPTVAPPPIVAPPLAGPEALELQGTVREEWMPLLKAPIVDPAKAQLTAAPAGLAALPASCDAFVSRKGAGAAPACADRAAALTALDGAMTESDAGKRDARLLDLEGCAGLPAGVARALRAELAPTECGEAIVARVLAAPPAGIDGNVHHALLGIAIASRLARTAQSAPTLAPPFTRPRVVEFTGGPMRTWISEQATAIQAVSQAAVELSYYGKAITAIEAGTAEMRLVESARNAPVPVDIAKDLELRNQYYATLDQALDPRKDRGRDAALVGLREMALVGAIHDARVDRARVLLARLYGGRRIDVLDALLLPALPPASPANVEERLAGKLPTFYAGMLLEPAAASRAGTLRMLLERGVPLAHRSALKTATLTADARGLFARARLELGRLYWRAVDFDQAAQLASAWPAGAARPAEATFTLALAIALRNGPDDAMDMMRKAPLQLTGIGKVQGLDHVAQQSPAGPDAAFAAFDAALIHQLAAPEAAGSAYWKEVSDRFRRAASLLTDPARKADAEARAKAASDLAAAVK